MYKKNRLKYLWISLIVCVFISLNMVNIFAASFSIKASASSVSASQKFKVTVNASGEGKFSFSASNGTVSVSQAWITGSYSFYVTAGKSGTTTVTVKAVDATGYDETAITGSKSVSVKIKSPSTGGGSTGGGSTGGGSTGSNTGTTTPTLSGENNLSELSVSTGALSPAFSAAVTSYKVELTSDTKSITVNAKAKDAKAQITGTGSHDLNIGENNIMLTVVAQNGAKKTYTISVYVTEKPTQFVKYNDQDMGVLSDFSKVDVPKGFTPVTIKVDGKDVSALKNETLGMTLLYLQGPDNKVAFYVYDKDAVLYPFETLTIDGRTFIKIAIPDSLDGLNGLEKKTITINDQKIEGWTFSDKALSNYSVLYLMNEQGEKSLYQYEVSENQIQKYVAHSEKATQSNTMIVPILIGTTIVFAIIAIASLIFYLRFKKKSIASIKEYYEKKTEE